MSTAFDMRMIVDRKKRAAQEVRQESDRPILVEIKKNLSYDLGVIARAAEDGLYESRFNLEHKTKRYRQLWTMEMQRRGFKVTTSSSVDGNFFVVSWAP